MDPESGFHLWVERSSVVSPSLAKLPTTPHTGLVLFGGKASCSLLGRFTGFLRIPGPVAASVWVSEGNH